MQYRPLMAAGQLSTKYGKIEDMVLSIETVLPDGTIGETGRAPASVPSQADSRAARAVLRARSEPVR